jgi:hypothetical protein
VNRTFWGLWKIFLIVLFYQGKKILPAPAPRRSIYQFEKYLSGLTAILSSREIWAA